MGHTREQHPSKVHELVAIVLSAKRIPRLVELGPRSFSDFTHDGELFVEHPCNDWLGFYDWLRSSSCNVVGLRIRIDTPESFDFSLLAGLKGVDVNETSGELTLFLAESREFQEGLSADQDFGGNRLFLGDKRAVALTFRAPWGL